MASFHVDEGPTPWMWYVLWERRAGSSMGFHGLFPGYNWVEASGCGEVSECAVNFVESRADKRWDSVYGYLFDVHNEA